MILQALSLFDGITLASLCALVASLLFSLISILLGLAKNKA